MSLQFLKLIKRWSLLACKLWVFRFKFLAETTSKLSVHTTFWKMFKSLTSVTQDVIKPRWKHCTWGKNNPSVIGKETIGRCYSHSLLKSLELTIIFSFTSQMGTPLEQPLPFVWQANCALNKVYAHQLQVRNIWVYSCSVCWPWSSWLCY